MKSNNTQRKTNDSPLQRITPAVAFRLICICLLWCFLVWIVIKSRPLSALTLFFIIASGIVVFVPLYKKYVRKTEGK